MNARIQAILVDFDGTLADTESLNAEAYRKALRHVGIDCRAEEVASAARGRHWRDFLTTWIDDPALASAVVTDKRRRYQDLVARAPLNQRLLDLLRRHAPGRKIGLVTTAATASTHAYLRAHEIADLFDVIVCGEDVTRPKPDPEAYILAGTRLGVEPGHALVFEDSGPGLAAARAYGARVRRVALNRLSNDTQNGS